MSENEKSPEEIKQQKVLDFKNRREAVGKKIRAISKFSGSVSESFYDDFIMNPALEWKRQFPAECQKSQYYHAFIGSTTDWEKSPNLDLPGGMIEEHLESIAARVEEEMKKLGIENPA